MEFLLEPDIVFLNHGSFGACPRVVHEEYQRLQRLLEAQPVRFLQREFSARLADARMTLARYIGADEDEVVFVTNPTFAVNEIARSLPLGEGDEVLISNHEYGACCNAWRFMSEMAGFSIVEQPIRLPVESNEHIVEQFWSGVTANTKVIFLSHLTSPTALTLPVHEICRRARERDITTVIDGAHAPGQLDLQMKDVGADYYVATCHKWLCAPKGSAFLYARREVQDLLKPLVVGWGWGEGRTIDCGSDFLDYHEWLGTDDPCAHLTVPKAIEFQQQHDWPTVRRRCHELAVEAIDRATEIAGIRRVHANEYFQQMALLELDQSANQDRVNQIKSQLYDDYHVEVPVILWQDHVFVRISVQAYNTSRDIDQLINALRTVVA